MDRDTERVFFLGLEEFWGLSFSVFLISRGSFPCLPFLDDFSGGRMSRLEFLSG